MRSDWHSRSVSGRPTAKPVRSSSCCPSVPSSSPFVCRQSLMSWKEADIRRCLGEEGHGAGSLLCECLQRMSVKVSRRLRFPGGDREQDWVQGQGQGDSPLVLQDKELQSSSKHAWPAHLPPPRQTAARRLPAVPITP